MSKGNIWAEPPESRSELDELRVVYGEARQHIDSLEEENQKKERQLYYLRGVIDTQRELIDSLLSKEKSSPELLQSLSQINNALEDISRAQRRKELRESAFGAFSVR